MKSVFSSFFLVVLFVVQSCGSDSDPIIEVPSAGSFSIYNKSESSYVKNHGDVTIGDTLLITFTPNPEFAAENFRTTISVNGKTIMGNEYIVGEDSETLDISAKSEAETSSHILCEQYEASLKLLYANIKLDYVVAMAELYPSPCQPSVTKTTKDSSSNNALQTAILKCQNLRVRFFTPIADAFLTDSR